MNKIHVALIAGLLALAALAGTFAATRTVSLGAAGKHASNAAIAARTRQLDAYASSLRRALANKPPAVPSVSGATAGPPAPAAPPLVIYHRPPPIVVVKHSSHSGEGIERGDSGGGDD